jgi:hypothetical protein
LSDVRRCKATTRKGTRCKRAAKAGSDFCGLPQHGGSGRSPGAPAGNQNARRTGFYAGLFTAEEVADLAAAAAAEGLDDEIALLRVRIRRAATEGEDLNAISRACGRLTQMLKAQQVLSGETIDRFQTAMSEVLAELDLELSLSLG